VKVHGVSEVSPKLKAPKLVLAIFCWLKKKKKKKKKVKRKGYCRFAIRGLSPWFAGTGKHRSTS
jgi:hypothetical protein